ncbi:hypothetical protein DESC_260113 [Desulfosarcina cetonica]|nr:hypothetical protein DESC_260113 [Desulfosarcina cetonica]
MIFMPLAGAGKGVKEVDCQKFLQAVKELIVMSGNCRVALQYGKDTGGRLRLGVGPP